jgi:hypothetical protein
MSDFIQSFDLSFDGRAGHLNELVWVIGWSNKKGYTLTDFDMLSIQYFEQRVLKLKCQ